MNAFKELLLVSDIISQHQCHPRTTQIITTMASIASTSTYNVQ